MREWAEKRAEGTVAGLQVGATANCPPRHRNVFETLVLDGILSRGEQYLPGPSGTSSCCPPCHSTRYKPSFLESDGILCCVEHCLPDFRASS